jgi:hypothetical protein
LEKRKEKMYTVTIASANDPNVMLYPAPTGKRHGEFRMVDNLVGAIVSVTEQGAQELCDALTKTTKGQWKVLQIPGECYTVPVAPEVFQKLQEDITK